MATIKTAIMVQDSMSPALRSMSNACRILLNNFEDMRKATSNTVDTQSLKLARAELNNTDMILNQIETTARNVNNETKKFPSNLNNATVASNNLLSKVKQIVVAVGGFTLAKKLVELSDESISITARINMMNDGLQTTAELQNQIFSAANRSRGSYLALSNTVASLGNQAKNAFSSSTEIVGFGELLNKMFTISGLDSTGIESTMYNLTQSLSSGKLLGNDYRILKQNAPQMIQYIQDFYKVSRSKLDDMVSKGQITAEGIKQAMFAAANDINTKFDTMPMTWSQIWTKIQNITIKALDPVLAKINELANNERVQAMVNMFVDGISIAAQAILILIEGMAWLIDVTEPLVPLILGVVAAYVAFNIISGIVSGVLGLLAIAHSIAGAAEMIHAGQTMAATAAQHGLNAALLACPVTWIIIAIMAIIVILTYLWFTNDEVAYALLFAWDMLIIGVMTLKLGCEAAFYGIILAGQFLLLGMVGVCYAMLFAWFSFLTGLEAIGVAILYIFQWLYNGVVDIVNGIISVLNKIPGVSIDYAEYANFADNAFEGMMDNVVRRNETLQSMVDDMNAINDSINSNKAKFAANLSSSATTITNKVIELDSTRQNRVNHRNDWINSASNALKDVMNSDSYNFDALNNKTLGDIANNTGQTASNTEISAEDLKYLIDLAERETINRFTTASVNINMTNNNNLNSETDIDGMVEQLATKLEEELQVVADGVHE